MIQGLNTTVHFLPEIIITVKNKTDKQINKKNHKEVHNKYRLVNK